MSILAGLFGGGSTTEKIVDGVINGADAAFYADEEKAIAAQKVLDFKIEWLKATQNQSLSRRFIAIVVSGLWGMYALIAGVARILGFEGLYGDIVAMMSDVINQPFMIIIGFYFAAHLLGRKVK